MKDVNGPEPAGQKDILSPRRRQIEKTITQNVTVKRLDEQTTQAEESRLQVDQFMIHGHRPLPGDQSGENALLQLQAVIHKRTWLETAEALLGIGAGAIQIERAALVDWGRWGSHSFSV